jgi:hypothetical protein
MRAIEVKGRIDAQGQLILEKLPSSLNDLGEVRVIVLYPDEILLDTDPDNMSAAEVEADLRAALQEAKNGERMSLSQMWAELEKN